MNESDVIFKKLEENKTKIGELLVTYTNLSQKKLNEALEIQETTGELLGEILTKKNFISPKDIIKVLCIQNDIPFQTSIKVDEIDPHIIRDIPINFAKLHEILPILETEFSVTIIIANPFNFNAINDLQALFRLPLSLLACDSAILQDAINRVYEKANKNLLDSIEDEFEENLDLDAPIDILDAEDEAPVIKFVYSLIFRAVKDKASDIHIEPYEKDTVYRFRINGVMSEVFRQPKRTHAAVSSRIKVMAKLDIAEKRLPQDGRIKIKIAGKDIDIRLSTVPIQNGERIVMRVLEKNNAIFDLESLGFQGQVLQGIHDLVRKKHGVVYVSGPTGHGKTTTLFAMLDKVNGPDRTIITVEDPVEYEIAGISQIQVNQKIDLSFAVALRSILRQNPDIIMVGETRDQETANMALTASQTGHFVLSTIHTNDASSVPTRLIDMGVEPFLISSSLVAALAQRLIRTLCEKCKQPKTPTQFELELLGINEIPPNATIFKAVGCEQCSHGYAGRTIVAELLLMNDDIRSLILNQSDSSSIKKAAVSSGMVTLRQDAVFKICMGITSIEEVVRAVNDDDSAHSIE